MVFEAIKIKPLLIIDICWMRRPEWTYGLKAQGTTSEQDFQLIKNIQELSVFAARMRLDGLFSVCGCLFYSNLQVDF